MTAPATKRVALQLWQEQFAAAPAPMTAREMRERGWDYVDIVFVTGDAYVDHPSFAMAILHRVLEAAGFRVAMLSQPDWRSCAPWRQFGRPRLFFAVSAGKAVRDLRDLRGVAFALGAKETACGLALCEGAKPQAVKLPSFEEVKSDRYAFAEATRLIHVHTNPYNAATLVQFHDNRAIVC